MISKKIDTTVSEYAILPIDLFPTGKLFEKIVSQSTTPGVALNIITDCISIRDRINARKSELERLEKEYERRRDELLNEEICIHHCIHHRYPWLIEKVQDPSGGSDHCKTCMVCGYVV